MLDSESRVLTANLPQQISINSKVNQVSTGLVTTTAVAMLSTFAINFLMNGAMNQVWGMINGL